MKKIFFLLLGLALCYSMEAQRVTNLRAEQSGQDVIVFYFLDANSACEVELFLSLDNGNTWGALLKGVSGDVGKNITKGSKQILWKVLDDRQELEGDKIKFKIVVNGRKSFEPEMIFVEGGAFQMGSNAGDLDEKPMHYVSLNSFSIAKYEITQAQYQSVMGRNPSVFKDCDNCPVDNVSWNDVQEFIQKLNTQTGRIYRLPTEAEWDYAAKGGKNCKAYSYSGSHDVSASAWYNSNSDGKSHPVGLKMPNELGICDMSGNVWEWCSDFYGSYNNFLETNPKGPSNGSQHVFRGGSWHFTQEHCRISNRLGSSSDLRAIDGGFRLVLSAE